jgi:hypothetical protein
MTSSSVEAYATVSLTLRAHRSHQKWGSLRTVKLNDA